MQVEDGVTDDPIGEQRPIPPVPNQPPVGEGGQVEVPIQHFGGIGGASSNDTVPVPPYVDVVASSSFQNETACIIGILVASCVELAQAGENCETKGVDCDENNGYAVAVGCVSLIVCLLYIVLFRFSPATLSQFNKFMPIFLFLWWGIGTLVLTFDSPFIETGNGYFACWGAVLLSIYYCQITVERFKVLGARISGAITGSQERKLLMLVMILSFVVAFASLVLWDDVNHALEKQSDQETWVFVAGIVSGSIAAIYLLLEIFKRGILGKVFLKYFSWFLVGWWMFGAGIATFDAPFPSTGNGYFCAWGAFLSSCYLCYCTTFTVSA